jgi:hypothetical protein
MSVKNNWNTNQTIFKRLFSTSIPLFKRLFFLRSHCFIENSHFPTSCICRYNNKIVLILQINIKFQWLMSCEERCYFELALVILCCFHNNFIKDWSMKLLYAQSNSSRNFRSKKCREVGFALFIKKWPYNKLFEIQL